MLQVFTSNCGLISRQVLDFYESYPEGKIDELRETLAATKTRPVPAPGWKAGFEATLLGIKANEAVMNKQRIELKGEWFET